MLENQDFKNDLQQHLFNFAVQLIFLIRKFLKGKAYEVINYQLIKAVTSSGANYAEARAAVKKADFANKIGISLK